MNLADALQEHDRLSKLINQGIAEMTERGLELAEAEYEYRKARAEAWCECPTDDAGVRAGEREWTAARREAWVDAETAAKRRVRDQADSMRDAAREAQRSRRTQLSALQTLVNAHQAEAEFERTAP